ncbi:hypothetical protein G9A89_020552 [Geosiphon pyriformis]|nr:hypothetical protein G9A89_020552 [Geosiphon pyriformis]
MYSSGEIPADGVGFLNDINNYAIVCCEGARPGASAKKAFDDDVKNARSLVGLFNHIVLFEANTRRQLFPDLKTYGAATFKTKMSLIMLDYRGTG